MDGRCQHVRMGLCVGYGNIGGWKFVSNTAIIIICLRSTVRTNLGRFYLRLVQSMTRALPCCSDRQSPPALSSSAVDQYLFENESCTISSSKFPCVRHWVDQVSFSGNYITAHRPRCWCCQENDATGILRADESSKIKILRRIMRAAASA